MRFKNYTAFTEPGGQINEDFCAASEQVLIAMDGATGLYKANFTTEESDARWLAKRGTEVLMEKLEGLTSGGENLPEIVHDTAIETGSEFFDFVKSSMSEGKEPDSDAFPSAGLALALICDDKIHVYSLGDLTTAVIYHDGRIDTVRGERLPELDGMVLDKMVSLSRENGKDVIEQKPFVLEDLRFNRNLRNKPEGYNIFDPSAEGAGKGIYRVFDACSVAKVLIVSDGISDAVGMYDIFDDFMQFVESVKADGGRAAYERLRQIQAEDPGCNRYPRFKIGDDVSIVYGEIEC